jgi:Ser/Thr protein kinase RdoA (MazF antagonist)
VPDSRLRQVFGASVSPLGGGYSGETFRAEIDGDDVVVRIYGRRPDRAAVDVGVLRRVRGVVPVPAVLDAQVTGARDLPPYVVTSWLPGERLEDVLTEVGEQTAAELGRAVGATLLALSTVRFDRPGELRGTDLAVAPFDLGSLADWVGGHLDRPWFAALGAEQTGDLLALARGVQPLLDSVAHESTLVHSDVNPKNLLVDRERAVVTGLLDWEFAYSGSRLADLGNLMRFPDHPAEPAGQAAFVGGALEVAARDLPPGWPDLARALDLLALVDLAARDVANPVVDAARDLLLETLRSGSLAAGRPDPLR